MPIKPKDIEKLILADGRYSRIRGALIKITYIRQNREKLQSLSMQRIFQKVQKIL